MDTKLKKFNDRLVVRACAFVLCVLMFVCGTVALVVTIQYAGGSDPFDQIATENYKDSNKFKEDLRNAISAVSSIYHYGSEEAIRKGDSVDPDIEKYKVRRYYNDYMYDKLWNWQEESDEPIPDSDLPYYNKIAEDGYDYFEPKPYDASVGEQVLKDYGAEVDAYAQKQKNDEIESQLTEFAEAKINLANFTYYVSDGKKMASNIPGNLGVSENVNTLAQDNKAAFLSKGYDTYFGGNAKYQNGTRLIDGDNIPNIFSDNLGNNDGTEFDNLSLFIGFNDDFFETLSNDYTKNRSVLLVSVTLTAVFYLLSLITLIYLIITTGRKDPEGKVKLYYTDRLFTEIQLGIMFSAAFVTVYFSYWIGLLNPQYVEEYNEYGVQITGTTPIYLSVSTYIMWSLLLFAVLSVGLWLFLSIVRMLKAHIFLKRSLFIIAVKAIYRCLNTAFSRTNPMGKFVLIIVVACLCSMTVVLGPIAIALLLGFGYGWIRKYTAVKKGVEEVTNGNLEYKIPVDDRSNSEFDQLARQINTISQASNIAIQNELKNQRLKTDLISNVSHDLKTPLTSIITYTDLLKKEGLNSPNAIRYLNVIDEKGRRLKTLTEDLFEAAKASSGSIPVRLEKVDMLALIKQGLVELDEGLRNKGLDIIINAPLDNYYVSADSQLLWRVVENLLNNVSKYALENSRLYIDLSETTLNDRSEPMTLFEMKNMSKAPLNIPEEELMERFKRGDESRTTEGSGLGLAIAKDLIRLQNGWFELKIDGDLFKSTVMLDTYNVAKMNAAAEQALAEEKMYSKQEDNMPGIKRE